MHPMLDNERRADLGAMAVEHVGAITRVALVEPASTAVTDVLAYIAHFCDRMGLDPERTFALALRSYEGDFEDGPAAVRRLDPDAPLIA